MRKVLKTILSVIFVVASMLSYAKDLGRVGQVYPIKEADLLDFIQLRLKKLQQSGELVKLQKKAIERSKKKADRPDPVKGISPTKKSRKWLIDPSTIITNDIKDADGKTIVKAGTVINPLKHISLKSTLVFYDGDSKLQTIWAIKKDKELKGKTRLILVNGSITEQINLFKKKIFFDQYGRLVDKLKIKHVPAIAFQEGLKIQAEEMEP